MIINIAGGTGIMGRIHAPVLEKAGHKVILSGRKTEPGLERAAQIADLTIVSVPIPATEEVIKQVAPYSGALMDFTSVKMLPVEWMLKYSNDSCGVSGLHPGYKNPSSLKGQTIVHCPTYRTNNRCLEVIAAFEKAGAEIIQKTPEEHDRDILSRKQNDRTTLFSAYALLMLRAKQEGQTFEEFYRFSPPPTKALIDLVSRQVGEDNDELYAHMRKYNPFQSSANAELMDCVLEAVSGEYNPAEIRKAFGKKLEEHQKQAEKIVSIYSHK